MEVNRPDVSGKLYPVTDDLTVVRYFSNAKGSGEQVSYKLNVPPGESWLSSDSLTSSIVTLDSSYTTTAFGEERLHDYYALPLFTMEWSGWCRSTGRKRYLFLSTDSGRKNTLQEDVAAQIGRGKIC